MLLPWHKAYPGHDGWRVQQSVIEGCWHDQSQRDYFARQLATHLNLPPFTFQDWTDALEHLGRHIKPGDIVLFDEISSYKFSISIWIKIKGIFPLKYAHKYKMKYTTVQTYSS